MRDKYCVHLSLLQLALCPHSLCGNRETLFASFSCCTFGCKPMRRGHEEPDRRFCISLYLYIHFVALHWTELVTSTLKPNTRNTQNVFRTFSIRSRYRNKTHVPYKSLLAVQYCNSPEMPSFLKGIGEFQDFKKRGFRFPESPCGVGPSPAHSLYKDFKNP